ncbi:MAG: glycoside hydrolase family 3 C-terminal domain-containing protein [Acidobacteria bacterium]|nr:glycoside hydrolase family 3 C-terminal domain-containing protein [Acidobacteriota bacterium]
MKGLIVSFILLGLIGQNFIFAQLLKTDKKAIKWVEETLKNFTLREKIGQMIIMPLNGEFTNAGSEKFAQMRRQIVENKVGGFTLFRGEANSIAVLTNEAQKLAKIPLFFSADYERGLRMQLRNGTPFTTNMGVAASGDVSAAQRQGKIICEEMRAIGANWLFAPVADINNNPDNPVINIRSFGADPKRVGEFVAALSGGVKEAGCLSTLKHFPGHGDTATDSHIGLSVVPLERARLDAVEFVPFRAGIDGGVDSVMTAHLAVPKVTNDELPATLNPKISIDILRKEFKFEGIITTDSMEMGAITKNFPNGASAVMAIKAGADVVLFPPKIEKAIEAIEAAVKKGEITELRINESVRRLLAAKYRLGLAENRFVDLAKVNQAVEKPENVREANLTAEKSITLLKNDDRIFPLTSEKAGKTLFVVIAADDDAVEGIAFTPEIQRRAPRAKIVRLDPRSTPQEYEKVLSDVREFDSIILAPFVKRAALKGTVALPENQTNFIKQIIQTNKPVAVIAFGSPYLIRQFPEAKNYVVTYAIEEVAQTALIRAMFGEVAFAGKLPVSIPGIFQIGAGIVK